jgi:hypothetical protein
MSIIKLFFLAGVVLMAGCKKSDSNKADEYSITLGGDGNLSNNAVGYAYTSTSNIPGLTINPVKVLSNNNGEITVNIKAKLPASHPLTNLMPSSMVDANGNVDIVQKYKNTSEGILDYTNASEKPFVIIKYSGAVGDKYVRTRSNGTTSTRTITYKSTTDDYPYGFFNIKVMKVEQNYDQHSKMPGFRKITYIANHKWGLVGLAFEAEDGTNYNINVY